MNFTIQEKEIRQKRQPKNKVQECSDNFISHNTILKFSCKVTVAVLGFFEHDNPMGFYCLFYFNHPFSIRVKLIKLQHKKKTTNQYQIQTITDLFLQKKTQNSS